MSCRCAIAWNTSDLAAASELAASGERAAGAIAVAVSLRAAGSAASSAGAGRLHVTSASADDLFLLVPGEFYSKVELAEAFEFAKHRDKF